VASFPYFNGTGFSCVCIRENRLSYEARNVGARVHYSVDLRIETHTESVASKYMENSPQNIRGYTDIFTVWGTAPRTSVPHCHEAWSRAGVTMSINTMRYDITEPSRSEPSQKNTSRPIPLDYFFTMHTLTRNICSPVDMQSHARRQQQRTLFAACNSDSFFSARCNIYISRLCYRRCQCPSVCPSVRDGSALAHYS